MLPTVEQAHVPRNSFPRRRVAAPTAQHSRAPRGDNLRLQAAAQVGSTRSMSFLPLRARKAVVEAGSVRDGP